MNLVKEAIINSMLYGMTYLIFKRNSVELDNYLNYEYHPNDASTAI